jgi:hypothetical protein
LCIKGHSTSLVVLLNSRRVFFIEEPIIQPGIEEHLEIRNPIPNVWVVVAHLPEELKRNWFGFAQQRFL